VVGTGGVMDLVKIRMRATHSIRLAQGSLVELVIRQPTPAQVTPMRLHPTSHGRAVQCASRDITSAQLHSLAEHHHIETLGGCKLRH
jgi:hypothetical protein